MGKFHYGELSTVNVRSEDHVVVCFIQYDDRSVGPVGPSEVAKSVFEMDL